MPGHPAPLASEKKLQKARNNAYCLLRTRPRSEAEVRQRLKLKGYSSEIVETIVSDLKRMGGIDDEKFARLWVESRMHSNPAGDVVLRYELKSKGVSDAVIDAALAEKAGRYDEHEVALGMAEEQFARFARLDKRKALKRLHDFLYRRGFAYDVIQRVLDNIAAKSRS